MDVRMAEKKTEEKDKRKRLIEMAATTPTPGKAWLQ